MSTPNASHPDSSAERSSRPSTALAGLGLLERSPDRFDSRVFWLTLTVAGRQGMFDLLEKSAEFVRPVAGRVSDRERAEV